MKISLVENFSCTLAVYWAFCLGGVTAVILCPDSSGCQHDCTLIHNKPQCFCYPGYTLQTDRQSCKPSRETRYGRLHRVTISGHQTAVSNSRQNGGCPGDKCNISKFHAVRTKPQKPNSRNICPSTLKMVVEMGIKLCVSPPQRTRFQTRFQSRLAAKKVQEFVHKTVKIIEEPMKLNNQTNHFQKFQDYPIIKKYQENRRKQRCRDDEVLVLTPRGAVCRRECEEGQTVREEQGIKKCLNSTTNISNKICPEGHKPMQTTIGILCEKIPQSIRLASSAKCAANERLVYLQSGPICIRGKSRRPTCNDGENLVQQGRKFYCVLPTSNVTSKCSPQEEEVHSDRGIGCRPKSCPQGMAPFETPAGTICLFQEQTIPAPHQRTGKSCAPGQTLIRTEKGEECWFTSGSPKLETKCPQGQVLVRGKVCKDLMSLSPDDIPCPPGQELVMTANGAHCQFRRLQSNKLSVQRTRCPEGQILTLGVDKFACHTATFDVMGIVCEPDQVVVQGPTNIVECISEEQTELVCKYGWFLSRTAQGYLCNHGDGENNPDPSSQCGNGEVFVVDEYGTRCVEVKEHSQLCGPGHQVIITTTGEVVCKAIDTQSQEKYESDPSCTGQCLTSKCREGSNPGPWKDCPDIYDVKRMACVPECANGGSCVNGRCICPPGLSGSACHDDVDECSNLPLDHCQFSCRNTFGGFHCVCPDGYTVGPDNRTCIEEHAQCLPGCLNGGKCRGGKCRCPLGFSGTFCQEDVNECETMRRPCEHRCRNTYGSYFCTCPPGSRLTEDKRTCQRATCTHNCINGGVCIRNRCRCPLGYYGIICQLDVDECLSNPCQHTCINTVGSYNCIG